jgi:uncharacterized protein
MKNIGKQFQVEILNLDDKENILEFDLNDSFFELFEQDLIKKGNLKAKVFLTKSLTTVKVDFDILGEIELVCDRSLREFLFEIDTLQTIYFKFGDKNEEISDEIVMIKQDTAHINLSQYLFDFIGIEIPIKKIHPDLITEKDNEEGDIFIYSSITDENELTDNDIDILDPRWEALKKLKDTF